MTDAAQEIQKEAFLKWVYLLVNNGAGVLINDIRTDKWHLENELMNGQAVISFNTFQGSGYDDSSASQAIGYEAAKGKIIEALESLGFDIRSHSILEANPSDRSSKDHIRVAIEPTPENLKKLQNAFIEGSISHAKREAEQAVQSCMTNLQRGNHFYCERLADLLGNEGVAPGTEIPTADMDAALAKMDADRRAVLGEYFQPHVLDAIFNAPEPTAAPAPVSVVASPPVPYGRVVDGEHAYDTGRGSAYGS